MSHCVYFEYRCPRGLAERDCAHCGQYEACVDEAWASAEKKIRETMKGNE